MTDELLDEILSIGGDIVFSDRFEKAWSVPHHGGDGSIASHSLEVAGHALILARRLGRCGVAVSEEDVVRAALLHDIGMTEESVFRSPASEKGRTHPVEGARIAREEFGANPTQEDAVLRHMWPVCSAVPPHTIEGLIVTVADKRSTFGDARRQVAWLAAVARSLVARGGRA